MAAASGERIDRLALGAALVTVVVWASAFVGIRAAAEDFSPGALALGRLAVGAFALGALILVRGPVRPANRDLLLIAASGVVWFALYMVTLNAAERIVDAGTAAMLTNTGPIFIAIFAAAFLGEGFPPRLLLGCAIAFGGAVVFGLATSGAPIDGGDPGLGIALCLLAAVAYASGVTLQKPALRTVRPDAVAGIACLVGAVTCLPFAPALATELGGADLANVGWLVYLGLFPTAIGFATWTFALSRTPAGRLGSTTYLVPPVVIVLSWLLLGEVPSWLAIVGGALCISGVIVARSSASPFNAIGPRFARMRG
jgi:drug/metabolite transporter (DMT)-like permease